MTNDIEIKEIVPIELEGGTLVNGFPSSGITSAIATESLINTSNFELQANIDSDKFPPISIIKNGNPTKGMTAFKGQISDDKIQKVASYVMTMVGTNPANAKDAQGDKCE